MAKAKPAEVASPVTAPVAAPVAAPVTAPLTAGHKSDAKPDRELAAHAIRCLYGCGIPESLERLAKYEDSTISAMAIAERENRRDRIPAILAKASPKKP